MAVTRRYRISGEGAIASYSTSEILSGTGIQTFNAFASRSSAGYAYNISSSEPYSDLISSSGSVASLGTYEIDFDTGELNLPRLIKGTANINVTWKVTNSTGGNDNFVFAKIRKWDGTTETEIAETSGAIISTSSASDTPRTVELKISDIASTLIAVGEQIRLTIGITGVTAGSSPKAHIAHDPQNRANDYFSTGNFDTTKLIANLPFRLDI